MENCFTKRKPNSKKKLPCHTKGGLRPQLHTNAQLHENAEKERNEKKKEESEREREESERSSE